MGYLSFLSRLFARPKTATANDGGVYFRVMCDACGEVIQGRVNPTSELSLADDGGYYVRKVLVGKQCFRTIEVSLHYADLGRTETGREIKGGTSVE